MLATWLFCTARRFCSANHVTFLSLRECEHTCFRKLLAYGTHQIRNILMELLTLSLCPSHPATARASMGKGLTPPHPLPSGRITSAQTLTPFSCVFSLNSFKKMQEVRRPPWKTALPVPVKPLMLTGLPCSSTSPFPRALCYQQTKAACAGAALVCAALSSWP